MADAFAGLDVAGELLVTRGVLEMHQRPAIRSASAGCDRGTAAVQAAIQALAGVEIAVDHGAGRRAAGQYLLPQLQAPRGAQFPRAQLGAGRAVELPVSAAACGDGSQQSAPGTSASSRRPGALARTAGTRSGRASANAVSAGGPAAAKQGWP
jgi:hypothetical protein